MRVIAIADTHVPDFAPALPAGLARDLASADLILHAGDVTSAGVLDELARYAPVRVAFGNNDRPDVRRWGAREIVHLDLDGVPTVLIHDAGPRVGRAARLARRFPDARLVIFGHSHVPLIEPTGTWHVPPGQQSASVVHGPLTGMHVSQLHLSAPVESGATNSALVPVAASSAASASPGSRRRPVTATSAPSRAAARAIAAPSPEVPPLISTTRSCRRGITVPA